MIGSGIPLARVYAIGLKAIALTRYGLIEASKAAPDAKFLVNAGSAPNHPDQDDDPDTVVTVGPK